MDQSLIAAEWNALVSSLHPMHHTATVTNQ